MEVLRMHETYYTPEQLAQLEARREEVGEDKIAAVEREWADLSRGHGAMLASKSAVGGAWIRDNPCCQID
jgi:hypothetical protein